MILLTNNAAQTIPVGGAVVFNDQILKNGCNTCRRNNTGAVTLREPGFYTISFNANVGGDTAATPVSLNIAVGGDILPETTMISTPAVATTEFNNVAATTAVRNCCGCDRITVVNTGTTPINIAANPTLYIRRA